MARKPLKIEAFEKLKSLGVPVGTVVDVGVLNSTWELLTAFQNSRQLLIEPIVEWNEVIERTYSQAGIDFEIINIAASDADGVMNMKVVSVVPGKPISHAHLTSQVSGNDLREVTVRKLDSLLAERDEPRPYLLKIDVDGVEMQILAGARKMLDECSIVVIEANITNYLERATVLEEAGFQLFDIVDPCYYDSRLRQFDLIFLSKKTIEELSIDMYKEKFDYNKWEVYK